MNLSKLVLSAPKLIGTGKSNGIKIYEQLAQSGEKVLTSYKPTVAEAYKTVVRYPVKTSFPEKCLQPGFTVSTTNKDVFVKKMGEAGHYIGHMTENYFLNNQPFKVDGYMKNYGSGVSVLSHMYTPSAKERSFAFLTKGALDSGKITELPSRELNVPVLWS